MGVYFRLEEVQMAVGHLQFRKVVMIIHMAMACALENVFLISKFVSVLDAINVFRHG